MQKHLARMIGYAAIAVVVALVIVFIVKSMHLGNGTSDSILAAVLTALLIIILSGRMVSM